MKVLMVIVSGGDDPVYQKHKQVWRTNHHPQVTSIFIEYSSDVSEIRLIDDTLLLPGVESLECMTRKTIDSIEYLVRNETYTHVLRTNLSSVWHFPQMISRLSTMRQNGLFGGVIGGSPYGLFVSGAGIHMTIDVALRLVELKDVACAISLQDDLAISYTLIQNGVTVTNIPSRVDFLTKEMFTEKCRMYPADHYHFRFKQSHDRSIEPDLMREFLVMLSFRSSTGQ